MYVRFLVADAHGAVVAQVGRLGDGQGLDPALLGAGPARVLQRSDEGFLVHSSSPIRGRDGEDIGVLIATAPLSEVRRRLITPASPPSAELRVVDAAGVPVLDGRSNPPDLQSDRAATGFQECLAGRSGVATYEDGRGIAVLGAHQCAGRDLGVLVELDRREAFAAANRLRRSNVIIGAVSAGLVAVAGFLLVVGLSRPIDALIAGAEAVAQGDYSVEIPVRADDEIGYLTTVFNRMTKMLRRSHASLEQLSNTDALTGLCNRRQLARTFTTELSRSVRTGDPLSVLMVDIDHFKAFNDKLGHPSGDKLLRETGALLASSLRPTDIPARYGGDELAIVLPATSKEAAGHKAEQLRREFADAGLGGVVEGSVTLSIGVAAYPDDGRTEQELIATTDAALYQAKRLGRNRVVVTGPASC